MLEFEFSSHGAGMIHAYRWEPEGQPRGVVQIIHGIAEYVPRYAGFAAFLNAHGLLVTGEDHTIEILLFTTIDFYIKT